MELIPGYTILYAQEDSSTQCTLRVWDSISLMEYILHHRDADEFNPALFSHTIPVRCEDFRMSSNPSTLEDDTYTIWVLMALIPSTACILKYHLSFSKCQQPQLT